MDFVHDQLATGPKLRIPTVEDTFSRYSPAVVPRFRFRAPDVIDVLERLCAEVGYPASIRVDQGSEFISRELDLWAYMKGVTLDFSRPSKPTDNAFIESFNGKFRAEGLNAHWFMSLDDAVRKCEAWRRDYNEVRPHSAIGNKPPISLMLASAAHGRPGARMLENRQQGSPETDSSSLRTWLYLCVLTSRVARHRLSLDFEGYGSTLPCRTIYAVGRKLLLQINFCL